MEATPTNVGTAGVGTGGSPGNGLPFADQPQLALDSIDTLGVKWATLHEAAGAIAAMAGIATDTLPVEVQAFPAALRDAGGWRLRLVEQGIEDLAALMQAGLSALLSAHAHGTRPHAAAQALWEEFILARDVMLGLAAKGESQDDG
ncbi:hypothetical protein [Novosphingobium mangrovi (ex Huang et al. 2023)]|uniref:Phasin domain-containing protein n=1 Tax=Novosphingobium mangrovi (ex Huang et al. 2023) TaxID=2976432 RepID=A0ABT2I9Q3_9SPHN|nr:hypothetical protein [Novosphingobium mangrovi (ex Huang et al. 2023)]MCT2401567.1 hypothetical protein [Novosphingobium mangrovi (ex Huang et al. 2023)]